MNMLVYPEVHLKITDVQKDQNKYIWTLQEDDGAKHTYLTGLKTGPRVYRLLHVENLKEDVRKYIGRDVWASRIFVTVHTEERDLKKITVTEADELKILPDFEGIPD